MSENAVPCSSTVFPTSPGPRSVTPTDSSTNTPSGLRQSIHAAMSLTSAIAYAGGRTLRLSCRSFPSLPSRLSVGLADRPTNHVSRARRIRVTQAERHRLEGRLEVGPQETSARRRPRALADTRPATSGNEGRRPASGTQYRPVTRTPWSDQRAKPVRPSPRVRSWRSRSISSRTAPSSRGRGRRSRWCRPACTA